MKDAEGVLAAVDAASEGVETLSQNVLGAIAAGKSGWYGARIKLSGGRVTVVQVTTDVEIVNAGDPSRTKKRRKSN